MKKFVVRIHEDLTIAAKKWCSARLEPHQWSFYSNTEKGEYIFLFENKIVAQQFEHEFIRWVKHD